MNPPTGRAMTTFENRPQARLERTALVTSRLLDFATQKELTAQIGHEPSVWPVVIVKELIDNAIDACEEAGIAPEIAVTVDTAGLTVTDNGPGLLPETIASVLDFSVRVSTREAYVSPTRGAQGNALKTILAIPFVLDGHQGRVTIEARGILHTIDVQVDRIKQEPVVGHEQAPSVVKSGTAVRVLWPDL